MRGARDATIAYEDGQGVAISLGADFVSEHEWGIKNIYSAFGINVSKIGVDPVGIRSRTVTKAVVDFDLEKRPYQDVLRLTQHSVKPDRRLSGVGWIGTLLSFTSANTPGVDDPRKLREMHDYPTTTYQHVDGKRVPVTNDEPLSTAWSDGDFAIFARSEADQKFLADLYQAFIDNDVAIWLGGGGVFQNAGLCFGIVSRMSQGMIDEFEQADLKAIELKSADEGTGIKPKLEQAGLRYYALSPKFVEDMRSVGENTDYEVVYWLNPMDQHKFNHGWFTVEQLEEWIEGRGPVLKVKEAVS